MGLFGAPEAHEDDPERALRAAFRCVNATGSQGEGLYLRVGVETGEAIVGQIGGGSGTHYGAMGEVVRIAAALQTAARPASVLVGPATRRATADLFEWGETEEVFTSEGSHPVLASCLERPKARPRAQAGRRRLAGSAPLVGRAPEMSALREALRKATAGNGGVVVLVGEPGLGKTRLVDECRKLFTAWVASGIGTAAALARGQGCLLCVHQALWSLPPATLRLAGRRPRRERRGYPSRPGTSRKGNLCREAGRRPGQPVGTGDGPSAC